MKKSIGFILFLLLLPLPACGVTPPLEFANESNATTTPASTVSVAVGLRRIESAIPSPSPEPRPGPVILDPASGYVPAVRVSRTLEDGGSVIAGRDDQWSETEPEYVYLYTDTAVYDLLISEISKHTENGTAEHWETGAYLYVPELKPGQAVRLYNAYPFFGEDGDGYLVRIAYTNSRNGYEAVLLLGEKESANPSLLPTEAHLSGRKHEIGADYSREGSFVPDDFRAKMLEGSFDAYVPVGMCIATGSLGDVNADGVEDALICLTSDGRRVSAYSGLMPMRILLGRPDGGYADGPWNTEALYTPYRSASYPITGQGYIDIQYDDVDGAACHHTYISRFRYDKEENGWLLKEISYQPTFTDDYTEMLSPAFVKAPPDIMNGSIERFNINTFYYAAADWDYFDAVCALDPSPQNDYGSAYTLAVKLDKDAGAYEGYIYRTFKSLNSGGFTHTIRGEYREGSEFTLTADKEGLSFVVQGDEWALSKTDDDAFYLVR